MIPHAERWGPFALDIEPPERIARCRCPRAIVHLTTGPRGQHAAALLHRAERDPIALPQALNALNDLTATDRRHVWASYAALSRPTRGA